MLIMSFIMYLERQFLLGINKCTSAAVPVAWFHTYMFHIIVSFWNHEINVSIWTVKSHCCLCTQIHFKKYLMCKSHLRETFMSGYNELFTNEINAHPQTSQKWVWFQIFTNFYLSSMSSTWHDFSVKKPSINS